MVYCFLVQEILKPLPCQAPCGIEERRFPTELSYRPGNIHTSTPRFIVRSLAVQFRFSNDMLHT